MTVTSTDILELLESLAADQWGIITTAQAKREGVSRLQMSRLSERGVLNRARQGVYLLPSASYGSLADVREAWVALNPGSFPHERLQSDTDVFVSHESAALIHNIGDLIPEYLTFSTAARKQTRQPDILIYNQRATKDSDICIIDGLPVTSVVRTVTDLAAKNIEFNYLAVIVTDALRKENVRISVLAEELDDAAPAYGFRNGQELIQACQAEASSNEDKQEATDRFATHLAAELTLNQINSRAFENINPVGKQLAKLALSNPLHDALDRLAKELSVQMAPAFDMKHRYPDIVRTAAEMGKGQAQQ